MIVEHGRVILDGNDVARAIDAYLVAHGVVVKGPRTIRVDDEPEGFLVTPGAVVTVEHTGLVLDVRNYGTDFMRRSDVLRELDALRGLRGSK